MINPPKTRKEALAIQYGPKDEGYPGWLQWFNEACCAYPITIGNWQCSRRPGHGPDNLYCRQHAKKVGG